MIIRSASYIGSFVETSKCPVSSRKEFAFIGRSNVGKSSLINFITNFNSLAKISNRPGKTQTLNYFLINEAWHLVDLPGYGYAKVSKVMRAKWEKMIKNFLIERENLTIVFQLVDGSIPTQQIDIEFTNWLGENGIPFALIFTKVDKRKKSEKNPIESYKNEMLKNWEHLPEIFMTSSTKRIGKNELFKFIDTLV